MLKCFKDDEQLTNDLYDAMEAYIAGDSKTGDQKMKESKQLWDTAMSGCGDIAEKMGKISQKFDKITQSSDWDEVSKKIYLANKDVIDRDVSLELREWTNGVFFNSGMFAGQIEKFFLEAEPEKDNSAPAKWIAGWWQGVSGQDKRDYIATCFTENADLTNTMFEAFDAYLKGDSATGDEKMAETKPLFEVALKGCSETNAEMDKVAKKFEELRQSPDWPKISAEVY